METPANDSTDTATVNCVCSGCAAKLAMPVDESEWHTLHHGDKMDSVESYLANRGDGWGIIRDEKEKRHVLCPSCISTSPLAMKPTIHEFETDCPKCCHPALESVTEYIGLTPYPGASVTEHLSRKCKRCGFIRIEKTWKPPIKTSEPKSKLSWLKNALRSKLLFKKPKN